MSTNLGASDSVGIDAIKKRYRNSLPDKAEELTQCMIALTVEQSSDHDLQAAHAFLHRFAGSSGMYGYDELSVQCQLAIEAIQESDRAKVLAQLQQLKQLLERYP